MEKTRRELDALIKEISKYLLGESRFSEGIFSALSSITGGLSLKLLTEKAGIKATELSDGVIPADTRP